jgi:hypothetical protein
MDAACRRNEERNIYESLNELVAWRSSVAAKNFA